MAILNALLQPEDAPVTTTRGTMGYQWDTTADRGMIHTMQIRDASITNAKISNFNFNQGTGGTLTLGGTANGNGVLRVLTSSDGTAVVANNNGLSGYGGSITILNTTDGTVLDKLGVVNSTLFTQSVITKEAGFNQEFTGSSDVSVTDGTISFSLNRTAICLFLMDGVCYSTRVSGTEDYGAYNIVKLFIDGSELTRAVETGADFDEDKIRGCGDTTLSSFATHQIATLGSGAHTFVAKVAQTEISGEPKFVLHMFKMSYIKIGT